MSLHAIKEYAKYRIDAKTMHGVHSPFVYAFIEEILCLKVDIKKNVPARLQNIKLSASLKRGSAIINILHHYNIKLYAILYTFEDMDLCRFKVITGPNDYVPAVCEEEFKIGRAEWVVKDKMVMGLLDISGYTGNWLEVFDKYQVLLSSNSIIIVNMIHNSPTNTQRWNELIKSDKVRLSIDLYHFGLLFFREEFKEKQHFVLKY